MYKLLLPSLNYIVLFQLRSNEQLFPHDELDTVIQKMKCAGKYAIHAQ